MQGFGLAGVGQQQEQANDRLQKEIVWVNIHAEVWFGKFGLAGVGQQQEQANDGLQ
jgi:hypothetical protein